jgi:hypothetical protein
VVIIIVVIVIFVFEKKSVDFVFLFDCLHWEINKLI